MKMIAAGAIGVAQFVWTVARVGPATLAAQVSQLGLMVPLVLALAGVRFVMQAAGWRLAIRESVRPSLLHALRAVIAGEAAGFRSRPKYKRKRGLTPVPVRGSDPN